MPFSIRPYRRFPVQCSATCKARRLVITLGVVALVLGSSGIGLALECEKGPEQTSQDWETEVNTAVAKIGPVSGGALTAKLKKGNKDLLGKLPDAGKLYMELKMLAMYCSSLRDDKAISESRKTQQLREYFVDIRAAIWPKKPTDAPPLKQPGKEKESSTQFRVNPPVPPLAQPEMKQPAAEKPCEQSLVGLKRPPEVFLPSWRSVVNSLRKNRLIHDLQNLFEVWGRIPSGLTGKDLIQEATFTLNCMGDRGELRMEQLGTTGRYWGEDFKNQMIVFRNP